jgi:Homeodomain-like domain
MILPFLIAMLATWIGRHQDHVIAYLHEENRILKAKPKRKRIPLTDTERRRLAVLAHPIDRKPLKDISTIATPDTLQRWYRRLVAQTPSRKPLGKSPGRPCVAMEIEQFVVRMATENPRWGYRRIQGALSNLGYHINNTTVRNILRRHHIDPAPIRGKAGVSWAQFVTLHLDVLEASGVFATSWLRVRRPWTEMTRIGCNLSVQGRQRLGLVFYNTLYGLTRVAQQWHTLWSRGLPPVDARYHLIFGRRRVPERSLQAVMPRARACLVEQDRSPPGARRVLIRPAGDLNCRRGALGSRVVTVSNAERERRQRCDHRHLTTAEDGVYPVAA